MSSFLLDILRCFCCCCDDPDFDNNYTPLYYDHYPNYNKAKVSSLGKSSQASHNAKTSSPLHLSNKPQSPVFPKPSSLLVDLFSGKSTLSSYLTPSGSINASSSSSPSGTNLHLSNKPQSSPVFPKPSSQLVDPFSRKSTLSSHLTPSGPINASSSSSSSSSGTNSVLSTPPGLKMTFNLPSPSPLSSGLTQSSPSQRVSSSKLPTTTPTPKLSKTSSLLSPSTSFPEHPPSSNPTLRPASSSKTNEQEHLLDANSSLPLYLVPKDVEDLIKNNITPQVLRRPLSPLTYKSYFAALLHAEDFYCKKWSDYKLQKVSLELQQITIHKRTNKKTKFNGHEKVIKTFVAIEIDSVPERRPFLLSRDLVHAKLCERNFEPFQGFVYRIAKSSVLLVDFGEDFYSRHRETNKYDISFTFNRVCLKRAHQAIEEASDSLFQNFLFPESRSRKVHPCIQVTHSSHQQLDPNQKNAVRQISLLHGSPPYLIKGPTCVHIDGWRENQTRKISRTGAVVKGAVFQIYSTSPNCKILICAPRNATCDELLISLKKVIPESNMFRAIAAFRERGEVPDDIFSQCDYDEHKELFTCPSLDELCRYKIIFSTFMSSFRLHAKGLAAGHFSHIFLLDTSATIEPEALVPMTKFAIDETTVIITGEREKQPYWVRSTIARRHGLKMSYFERLEERMPYRNHNPSFVSEVYEEDTETNGNFM